MVEYAYIELIARGSNSEKSESIIDVLPSTIYNFIQSLTFFDSLSTHFLSVDDIAVYDC